MQHQTSMFTGFEGLNLFYQSWLPPKPSFATVIVVHGVGEHSGRYINIVKQLVPLGIAIYSYDQRGYGLSPGRRGYINGWHEYREDLREFVQHVNNIRGNTPLFLLGHSMGGLVVLDYVLHYPDGLQGVVASAPALPLKGDIPAWFIRLATLLNRITPTLQLKTPLQIEAVSRDPQVVQAYLNDPLIHYYTTPRSVVSFENTATWVHQHASQLRLPLLMTHGEQDRLVPIHCTQPFFEQVCSTDKQFITYSNGYHETHNDLSYIEAISNLGRWFIKRSDISQ